MMGCEHNSPAAAIAMVQFGYDSPDLGEWWG